MMQRVSQEATEIAGLMEAVFAVHAEDPRDADRRRDLVSYNEVLKEFGPEIAAREARPPRSRIDELMAALFRELGYWPDYRRASA